MKELKQFETVHHSEIDEKFHQLTLGNIGNVIYWMQFFELTSTISGDIVECGVGRGRSLLIITALNYLLSESEGGQRMIWGYDSFEGFPPPEIQDKSPRNVQKGEWSHSPTGKYKYSIEFAKTVFREANVSVDNVVLKKGFFIDTLKNHPDKPIAMLHIDGDLYQSHVDVLTSLYDKVVQGGVVIFDDLHGEQKINRDFPGANLAVKEFLKDKFQQIKMSIGGTCYLVKQ